MLSPFLSDALRYSLAEKLGKWGIAARSHRPSRSLRDEPVSQALITLAKIGYPEWRFAPSRFDLAYLFVQVIEGMEVADKIVNLDRDGNDCPLTEAKMLRVTVE